jgi:trans-aconitate methyltransferase
MQIFTSVKWQNEAIFDLCAVQMVDVGCGLGSSSRLISKKFNATAQGITLSPVQVPLALSHFPSRVHVT